VHWVKLRHSTQVLDAVSQKGVAPLHVVSSVHATQRPFLHRGAAPPHWVSSTQLEVQRWLLQNGLPGTPLQSGPVLHSTQMLLTTSQTGLPGIAAQRVVSLALHSSQVPGPEGEGTHAGLVVVGQRDVAPELLLPLHRVQTLLVQTGVFEGQVALSRQLTQTPSVGGTFAPRSQTVFVGSRVQITGTAGSFELHSTQAPAFAPAVRQAGFAAVQGNLFAGPGVDPKLPLQPTQVLRSTSQEPRLPVQAVALLWLHSRHAPFTHAGLAAVGQALGLATPKSAVHAVQPLAMQTGSPEGQSADVAHA
jgi:hypothetical protein